MASCRAGNAAASVSAALLSNKRRLSVRCSPLSNLSAASNHPTAVSEQLTLITHRTRIRLSVTEVFSGCAAATVRSRPARHVRRHLQTGQPAIGRAQSMPRWSGPGQGSECLDQRTRRFRPALRNRGCARYWSPAPHLSRLRCVSVTGSGCNRDLWNRRRFCPPIPSRGISRAPNAD